MAKAGEKGEQKANLYFLAIVAIVAVVGIVVLVLNAGNVGIVTESAEEVTLISSLEESDSDLTGQAAARSPTKKRTPQAGEEDTCCRWIKNQYNVVKCTCTTSSSDCTSNCGT